MATRSIRVLLVDDYEPFRRFVASVLQQRPELQIVAEVSDGLDAVQKTKELEPDLVLLDIGLPSLNGIEVANRIRRLSPTSKIIFLSQESSSDFVEEAFRLGAWGYILKLDARSELMTAVQAVLGGGRYISNRLAGHDFTGASDALATESSQQVSELVSEQRAQVSHRHEVQFYSDDGCFLDGFAQFVGTALKAGHAVVVVVTEAHRDNLLPRLEAYDVNIGPAIEEGRYISLDVVETLSTFMFNGLPDPVRFLKVAGDLIGGAAKAAKVVPPRVAACGECAPLLWAQGNAEAAIRLERLWSEVGRRYDVDVLCAYPLASFQGGIGSHVFERICAEHSVVQSR